MDLDSSKFKKIHEDENSSIYKHPDGHIVHLAKGGNVKHFDDGGGTIDYNALQNDPGNVAYGTTPEPQAPLDATIPNSQDNINIAQSPGELAAQPESTQAPSLGPSNYAIPSQQPTPPSQDADSDLAKNPYVKQAAQTEAALQSQEMIKGKAAQEQEYAESQGAQQLQAQQAAGQQNLNHILNEALTVGQNAQHNPVVAKQFPGVVNGLGDAIGLLFGGISSGLTGQENPMIKYMRDQQQKDIDAQMANMGNEHNLASFYTNLYGNVKDAQLMLQASSNAIIQNKVAAAASKSGSANAQNAATLVKNAFDVQTPAMAISARQSGLQALDQTLGEGTQQTQGGNNPTQPSYDPAKAFSHLSQQIRMLPNADPSTINSALGEVKAQQNIETANSFAKDAFQKVSQLSTLPGHLVSPLQQGRQIAAMWDPMIDKLTKTSEGRVTPITVDMINKVKPAVGDSPETAQVKALGFQRLINQERSTPIIDSLGLKAPKTGVGGGFAKPNPNAPPNYPR